MRIDNISEIVEAIARRHDEISMALQNVSADALSGDSLLPGWSRLTIICHLRYGAEASLAMTNDALRGVETSFYPEGRARQRPATLAPRMGEDGSAAVRSLREASANLDLTWHALDVSGFDTVVEEPTDNPDLGPTTLGLLALLRLTEVEVHGADLNLGLSPWSDVFVTTALPMRIQWLPTRRSNHTAVDGDIHGTWVLRCDEGEFFSISATADGVTISNDHNDDENADVVIGGPSRDLLGFLLGRTDVSALTVTGNHEMAATFHRAFPAP